MEIGETLLVHTAAEWREWLAQNHATKKEIWLIYYKKTSGKTGITYEESVEQALCFGWIDGAIKGIDKDTYAGRFTPRRAKSPWSESNRERVARLLREGSMTEAGLAVLPEALRSVLFSVEMKRPRTKKRSRAITAHDSLRLHGLLNDSNKLPFQLAQVYLVAQGRSEGGQGAGGVVFAAIEAAINEYLDSPAQWLEESGDDEARDNDGYLGVLMEKPSQERLHLERFLWQGTRPEGITGDMSVICR